MRIYGAQKRGGRKKRSISGKGGVVIGGTSFNPLKRVDTPSHLHMAIHRSDSLIERWEMCTSKL